MKLGSSFLQFHLKRITENQTVRTCMNKVSVSLCYTGGRWLKKSLLYPTFVFVSYYSLVLEAVLSILHSQVFLIKKYPQSGFKQTNITNKTTTHIVNNKWACSQRTKVANGKSQVSTQYSVITYMGKESKKECVCVCIYIYIYIYMCVYIYI